MRREFRLHHMAALSAKLVGLHMRDGAVGDLASNHYIDNGHDTEENHQALDHNPAVRHRQTSGDAPLAEEHADRNQRKPGEEDDWNTDESKQPDVGVSGAAAQVKRENKEPGEPGSSDERGAEETHPIAGEQKKHGTLGIDALVIGHWEQL